MTDVLFRHQYMLRVSLNSDEIAVAALNVFEQEPYAPVAPEKDLRRLEIRHAVAER